MAWVIVEILYGTNFEYKYVSDQLVVECMRGAIIPDSSAESYGSLYRLFCMYVQVRTPTC